MIIRDNFCEFCIKTYVVTPHLDCLDEKVTSILKFIKGHNCVQKGRWSYGSSCLYIA